MGRPADLEALAPTGTLRVGVNLGNALLVSSRTTDGTPVGISPEVGGEIARRLGLPLEFVCRARPAMLVDDVDAWDIALVAVDAARTEHITFTAPYADIEATYLVASGSSYTTVNDLDRAGARIAVAKGSAYDLWLSRNLKHATVVSVVGGPMAGVENFLSAGSDAAAGLRGVLQTVNLAGVRVLPDNFSTVGQAVGVPRTRGDAVARLVAAVVDEIRSSGLVADFIARHGSRGVTPSR